MTEDQMFDRLVAAEEDVFAAALQFANSAHQARIIRSDVAHDAADASLAMLVEAVQQYVEIEAQTLEDDPSSLN